MLHVLPDVDSLAAANSFREKELVKKDYSTTMFRPRYTFGLTSSPIHKDGRCGSIDCKSNGIDSLPQSALLCILWGKRR